MRPSTFFLRALVALAGPLVVTVSGCASLVGLEDKEPGPATTTGAGGTALSTGGHGGALAGNGGSTSAGHGGSTAGGGGHGGSSGAGAASGHGGSTAGGGGKSAGGKGGGGASTGGAPGAGGIGPGGASGGDGGSPVVGVGGAAGVGGDPGVGGAAGDTSAGGDSSAGGDTSAGAGGTAGSGGDAGGGGTGGAFFPAGSIIYGIVDPSNAPPDEYQLFRVAASPGAVPENLSALLAAAMSAKGADGGAGVSPDGQWMAFVTERGCPENVSCLGTAANDGVLTGAAIARWKMDFMSPPILARGRPTISSDGLRVVFSAVPMEGGMQLYTATRADTDPATLFTEPLQLTTMALTGHAFNVRATFDPAGPSILFDCLAPAAIADYDTVGGGVCQIGLDGTGFVDGVVSPSQLLGAYPSQNTAVHAWKTAAGEILFTGAPHTEPTTNDEQIWQRDAMGTLSILSMSGRYSQQAPCVFPDQRVAFLDLDDPSVPMGIAVSIAASPAAIQTATPIALLTAASSTSGTIDRYISCGGP